jgi:putative polyketide hydroxylase
VGAAAEVAARLGIDIGAHRIAPGTVLSDPHGRWPNAAGLTGSGALLVRPDGYVAWRAHTATPGPAAALEDALNRVLARGRADVHQPDVL